MNAEPYPDLEIYIQHAEIALLREWIGTLFEIEANSPAAGRSQTHNDKSITLSLNEGDMQVIIVPNAVKKKFTSLWIKPNHTQWATDRDMALAAWTHFKTEIRCSRGSWDEETGEGTRQDIAQDTSPGTSQDLLQDTPQDLPADKQAWLRFTQNGETIVNWLTV